MISQAMLCDKRLNSELLNKRHISRRVEIESICRWKRNRCSKNWIFVLCELKTLREKEKMLLTRIYSSSHDGLKRFLFQSR